MYGAVGTFHISVSYDIPWRFQRKVLPTIVGKYTTDQTYEDRQSLCWPIATIIEFRPDLFRSGLLRAQLFVVSPMQARYTDPEGEPTETIGIKNAKNPRT